MKILLDAHIPTAVTRGLSGHGFDAVALRSWRGGRFLDATDEAILVGAGEEERVFVTYDVHTVSSLLRRWLEDGTEHTGVVLIRAKTVLPNDVGTAVHDLLQLCRTYQDQPWANRVVFLTR